MLLLYFGVAELTVGMMANGRAAHVASVVGDLVTQMPAVNQTDIDNVFLVGGAIMKPFPTTSLKMRVTSITANDAGVANVAWSRATANFSALDTGPAAGFPAGLLAAKESMIQAEVEYTYTSPTKLTMPLPLTFKSKYFIKPRRSDAVLFSG